ncbi:MAG: nuclear transport factor 2 family protein [Bacteroidia bacterium]
MSTPQTHEQLIARFYSAFQAGDAETMAACYAPDAQFEDPAFGQLDGAAAGDMWRMLIQRGGKDLQVQFSEVRGTPTGGSALWEAHYLFGPARRPVHNRIRTSFEIRDGQIVRHRDVFDFWRWSRMALGPTGLLLGWTPFMRAQVRKRSRGLLERFRRSG